MFKKSILLKRLSYPSPHPQFSHLCQFSTPAISDEKYQTQVFEAVHELLSQSKTANPRDYMPRAWDSGKFGDQELFNAQGVSTDLRQAREQLYGLLCVHRFNLAESLLKKIDQILQYELQSTKIVSVADIAPKVQPDYPACVVWKGDITTLRVDAIVNAANKYMLGCFRPGHRCIDNAIHDKAGPRLRQACRELMRVKEELLPTGTAVITPAFCLPSKWVLHTVGPIYSPHIDSTDSLSSCYTECFKISKANGIRSIAFCCISTGEFAYPSDLAADTALRVVKNYLDKDDNASHFDSIIFNVFKPKDAELYQSKIQQLFPNTQN